MADAKKVLMLTLDMAGNWPPELELIRSLVVAGHDVKVISTANHQRAATAAGARFENYRFAPERDTAAPRPPRTAAEERQFVLGQVLLNPVYSDELLAAVERERPDVILLDNVLLQAMAACEATGVATAALFHSVFWGTAQRRLAWPPAMQSAINAHRQSLGLATLADAHAQLTATAANLVFTYADLDEAPSRALPNLHFVGPLLRRDGVANLVLPWPDDDARPLILVSFSTSFQNQLDVLQRVADAVATLTARVLLTLGDAVAASDLRLPSNVHAVPFVPHAAVLPLASLVVTHAGHGTVIAAATFGVPLLCLPMGRDQFDVSRCAQRAGMAREAPMDATPEQLREAIAGALADQQLLAAARRFAARQDVEAGRHKAVDVISSL
jgi:MGT family glycosyltransferase